MTELIFGCALVLTIIVSAVIITNLRIALTRTEQEYEDKVSRLQQQVDMYSSESIVLNDICDNAENKLKIIERDMRLRKDIEDVTTITLKFDTSELRNSFIDYLDASSFLQEWKQVYGDKTLIDNLDEIVKTSYTDKGSLVLTVKVKVVPKK